MLQKIKKLRLRLKEYRQEYRRMHKEEIGEYLKIWNKQHPEKIIEYRERAKRKKTSMRSDKECK